MAFTVQDAQADIASYQPPEDKAAAPHPMAAPADAKPDPIQASMAPPPAKTTPTFLDSVLSTVDNYTSKLAEHVANDTAVRLIRQGQAGFVKGVVNTADSVASAAKASGAGLAAAEDPAHAEEALTGPDVFHPAYDHARQAALGLRDALAVKDPSIPEYLAEGAGQMMPSFLMFSRVLGSIGNAAELAGGAKKAVDLARFATADAATNATAVAPHDPRLSDTVALMAHSEGKFSDLLRQVAPDGVLRYIDYLADHKNESEAEGRWKNVVDGWGAAAAITGVVHTAGGVFKQGWNALHYMADNNMGSMGDLMPSNQEGKIVFHGTTANFDEFKDEAIGTGEGNQTFGHGHYFAENQETANTYSRMALSRAGMTGAIIGDAQKAVKTFGGRAEAYTNLSQQAAQETDPALRMRLQSTMRMIRSGNYDRSSPTLMHVEIPDEHINNMMHWDKPLSAQPKLKSTLENLKLDVQPEGTNYRILVNDKPAALIADSSLARGIVNKVSSLALGENVHGGEVYDRLVDLLGSPQKVSEFLSRRGIPGIKYLDQGSRAAGEGTNNLVLFNSKHATIVKKEK